MKRNGGRDVFGEKKAAVHALNRKFAALKKSGDRVTAAQCAEKDALIDAMQASCAHRKCLETQGGKMANPLSPMSQPSRLCIDCGFLEYKRDAGYATLSVGKAKRLPHDAYLLECGLVLIETGINIRER